jgi:nitrite reductase (NADH) large subunit
LANGTELAFSKLVFATGSQPIRLALPGMDLPGVLTFRDIDDVNVIAANKSARARVVVIGGGLLGLEAAYGLAKAGAKVTLLHLMDRLMERQLDPCAARMLARAVEGKGIAVRLQAETARIIGSERRGGGAGRRITIAADAVVVARSAFARAPGSPSSRALRSSAASSSTINCSRAPRTFLRSANAPSIAASATALSSRLTSRRASWRDISPARA